MAIPRRTISMNASGISIDAARCRAVIDRDAVSVLSTSRGVEKLLGSAELFVGVSLILFVCAGEVCENTLNLYTRSPLRDAAYCLYSFVIHREADAVRATIEPP